MARFTEADEVQTDVHSFPCLGCRVQLELSARSVFRFSNCVDRSMRSLRKFVPISLEVLCLPLKRSH